MAGVYILCALCAVLAVTVAVGYNRGKIILASTAKFCASMCFIAVAVILAILKTADTYAILFIAALACGALGDMFIMSKQFYGEQARSDYFLIMGIAAFGIGHLIYSAVLFSAASSFAYWLIVLYVIPPIVVIVPKKSGFADSGKMTPYMLIYGMVLITTLIASANLLVYGYTVRALLLTIASACFLISDGALSINFYGPRNLFKPTNYAVMIFYYAAQLLFAWSIFA